MNPLFKSLYDEVIIRTNRPNLIQETIKAIKDATLFYHSRGKFKKDTRIVGIQASNPGAYTVQFRLPSDSKIRQIIGIQPVDSSGKLGIMIPELEIGESKKCSTYFTWINDSLTIKLSEPVAQFQLYYLAYPNVDPIHYDSWVAKIYPQFIVDYASARVFLDIGVDAKAKNLMALVGEFRLPGSHVWTLFSDNPEVKVYGD